jgi:hypothetical protein
MARRKVVTSVSVDPEVFHVGREEGYNFSELLEQAIIDRQEPEKEIAYLKGKIKYHEDKALELRERVEIVKKADNKLKKLILKNAIEKYLPDYQQLGVLPDEVEQHLCMKLKLTPEKLLEVFDEFSE